MGLHTTREQKKWAAVRRAQFALETALRRIDYIEDVVKPELEALDQGTKKIKPSGDPAADAQKALPEPEAD